MYAFCPSTFQFFPVELKKLYQQSQSWPEVFVLIDEAAYQTLHRDLPEGYQFGADADGHPCYVPAGPLDPEQQLAFNRLKRRSMLEEVRSVICELEELIFEGLAKPEDIAQLAQLKAHRREVLQVDLSQLKPKWPQLDPVLLR